MKKLVAVAVSGGVDSSTAAFLLKKAGYEVIGLHMHLWHESGQNVSADPVQNSEARTVDKAEQACHIMGIPFRVIDLGESFKSHVVNYFSEMYARGKTPNPCIICNKSIKFGLLLDAALALGADFLAAGHYAKVDHFDAAYHLFKSVDISKDQSYVLYTLGQKELSRVILPLGNLLKREVRDIARDIGITNATEAESQDICFIDDKYQDFLRRSMPAKTNGEIINSQGKVLGQHSGISFYTIGQRHGLGVAAEQRLYVIRIEPESNRIVVGFEEELYSSRLIANEISWVVGGLSVKSIDVNVKIRYKSPEVAATLYPRFDSVEVEFHKPQRAVTPGQAVVFYKNNEVLGGGTIEKTKD
ncbi:tRNA 2-thiouridine(34) synthase MnmA [Chloroflexota bacterium]